MYEILITDGVAEFYLNPVSTNDLCFRFETIEQAIDLVKIALDQNMFAVISAV